MTPITDVRLQNLGPAQAGVPVTFGQVFKAGDVSVSDVLVGSLGGTALPLQTDVKATHADGSVRHAIVSAVVPHLAAGTAVLSLSKGGVLAEAVKTAWPDEFSVQINLTIAGLVYRASAAQNDLRKWLEGAVVTENQCMMVFATDDGVKHPHLAARFAVRDYHGAGKLRADVAVENNWAFESGPQNFKYDVEILVGGKLVYSKLGLTHLTHARWRKVFWHGDAPRVNVQIDSAYLIASRAVPNYDMAFPPSEGTLKRLAVCALSGEPMQIGAASPYFPTTGANEEIGILPMWDTAWIMSQDSRARDCVLVTGNGAGSYPVHFRDKDSGLPVSLSKYPYMTIAGNPGDTWNEKEKRRESFPTYGNDRAAAGLAAVQALNSDGTTNGDDVPWHTPFTPDEAHQPSLAYTAYLATGDYFYLEEMQFWAMWNSFWDNPNYRGAGLGLIIAGELRAQAWALRTIAQAAFITPDDHPLKADLLALVRNNLAWYTNQYVGGPGDNKIGVPTHGGSIAHDAGLSIAPWMHDYFVGVLGHLIGLGFVEAKPFLLWMCRFTIGRMVGPGICWVLSAQYDLQIRDSVTSPVYDSLVHSYNNRAGVGPKVLALPCAGLEMAAAVGRPVRDMGNISDGNMGYPAWMQPAISAAVDAGYPDADVAWTDFMSRSVKPDYTQGAHFAIVPCDSDTVTFPPIQPPQGDKMTYKLSVVLAMAAQQLDAQSQAAPTTIRGEVLTADGQTVVASVDNGPFEFPGLAEGDYVFRASGLDSNAVVMGVPFQVAFTANDVTAPPGDPAPGGTIDVQLPSGAALTLTREQ